MRAQEDTDVINDNNTKIYIKKKDNNIKQKYRVRNLFVSVCLTKSNSSPLVRTLLRSTVRRFFERQRYFLWPVVISTHYPNELPPSRLEYAFARKAYPAASLKPW